MTVFLNGEFVPEERAMISVFDRGFIYGDGLFETIYICNGKPFRWKQHLERFEQGATFLGIELPIAPDALARFVRELIAQNQRSAALLRLILSRGVGPRGYSPKGTTRPTLVMSLHPAAEVPADSPPNWRLVTSSFRLPANEPLAHFKTCNKLAQILARAQADAAGADEALLSSSDGCLIEGSSSNLFWVAENAIQTPELAVGVLPGVTRAFVLEMGAALGYEVRQNKIRVESLRKADGVFLSLSSVGIAEASSLDGHGLSRSAITRSLYETYWRRVGEECA